MDIIIEGIITAEDGMNDVIETIIHLKSVPNALLRVSCKEAGLQGRVGFGPGGHILGAHIDDTDEIGYPAVKKLLTVRTGNYAVLDMGHEHTTEVNQTLWIKADKILEIWPDLPDSPRNLLGASLSSIPALQRALPTTGEQKSESLSRLKQHYGKSKEHEAHLTRWHLALRLSWLLVTLLFVFIIVRYGHTLLTPLLGARHLFQK